jgi:3-hydroxy-3-methylglutaryl CoA synthase
MAFQDHRTLCNLARPRKKSEIQESFQAKVLPSLRYAQRVGSTYGASNLIGLCGLLKSEAAYAPGDRIGFFAYGSGAMGEFYSARICPEARAQMAGLDLDTTLDQRREVTFSEYEQVETIRESYIEQPDVTPDLGLLDGWYARHYAGKRYLVLTGVKDYVRTYEWSDARDPRGV